MGKMFPTKSPPQGRSFRIPLHEFPRATTWTPLWWVLCSRRFRTIPQELVL